MRGTRKPAGIRRGTLAALLAILAGLAAVGPALTATDPAATPPAPGQTFTLVIPFTAHATGFGTE